jgi:hypothetical protein
MNLKEQFRQKGLELKKQLKEVEVTGLKAFIGKFTAGERELIMPAIVAASENADSKEKYKGMFNSMAEVVQFAIKDGNGERVFDDSEDDLSIVKSLDGESVQTLFEEILEFNGLTDEAVKEEAKN